MNLKILAMLIIYWSIWIIVASSISAMDVYTNAQLNSSELSANETDRAGLFNQGISFGRYFTLVGFGIGLPSGTPLWFSLLFGALQTGMSVFTAGFIISSIWDG